MLRWSISRLRYLTKKTFDSTWRFLCVHIKREFRTAQLLVGRSIVGSISCVVLWLPPVLRNSGNCWSPFTNLWNEKKKNNNNDNSERSIVLSGVLACRLPSTNKSNFQWSMNASKGLSIAFFVHIVVQFGEAMSSEKYQRTCEIIARQGDVCRGKNNSCSVDHRPGEWIGRTSSLHALLKEFTSSWIRGTSLWRNVTCVTATYYENCRSNDVSMLSAMRTFRSCCMRQRVRCCRDLCQGDCCSASHD